MVEPPDAIPTARRRWPRPRAAVLAPLALAALAGPGCGMVPKAKLDDCHRVSQTLRAENGRLKDVALDLRAQNQDLTQRAVDDARRLAAHEEAVGRLEASVTAYQAERDALASAFESVKRQLRTTVSPHPAALPSRLESFAAAHPSWSFDPKAMTLGAPAADLFEPGSDRLRPGAAEALDALGAELRPGGAPAVEVVEPPDAPPVDRANYRGGPDQAAAGRFLGAARAARVRDRIASAAGLDHARARIAPPADPPADGVRRIAVRVGPPPAPSLDSTPGGPR